MEHELVIRLLIRHGSNVEWMDPCHGSGGGPIGTLPVTVAGPSDL